MHKWKIFRKAAPLFLSAAVAMTNLPVNVFAEDVFSSDAVVEEVYFETAAAEEIPSEELAAEDVFGSGEIEFTTEEAVEELSDGASEETAEAANENVEYILMNIPYSQFYAADLNNNVAVDAMTSATLNKTRTGRMVGGSYHVDPNGTDITGVTFPVKVPAGMDLSGYTRVTDENSVDITVTNKGQTATTTYAGKEALFESPSYSYYVLNEAPQFYKEVTVNADGSLSFGAIVGQTTKISGTAELATQSNYGDYQLNISGVENYITSEDKIYGVVIGTKEGAEYGLRHMENIWFATALSWCTGFTSVVHNCPTSSDHYASMMGKTIDKVTYYTEKGIYEIDLADMYVPVKFENTVEVENASISAGKTTVKVTGLPSDYKAEYSVEGLNVSVEGNTLKYSNAAKGAYTLSIKDANGKYAPLSASFNLYTDSMPAAYDTKANAVKAAEGATAEAFADYIQNISSVSVNGTAYAPVGKHSVVIINDDGTIKTDATPIAETGVYDITVSSTGYKDLSFRYANGVTEITLNKDKVTLFVNKTQNLSAQTLGAAEIVYSSSDESIAKVDQNGKITAVKEGKAIITATYGTAKATCEVTVDATLKSNKSTLTLDAKSAKKGTVKGILTGAKSGAKVTYKSENTKVVKVDSKGNVSVVGPGKTKIVMTYKTASKTIKASCNVVVKGFKINKSKITLYTKGWAKTTLTMTKTGISGTYKFKSSNTKVATVDKNGKITAKKAGTTTIKVTCGKYSRSIKVTVKKPVLTLAKSSATIQVGKTTTISAKATPSKTIKYKSSNTKVATVSSTGVVKGVKKGTATITVTCNGVSKTFKVTVK